VRVTLDEEERDPLRSRRPGTSCGDDDTVGDVPVEDERLRPLEAEAGALGSRLQRDAGLVPTRALLGEGESRHRLARRDAGKERAPLLLGRAVADGAGPKAHRAEVRRAEQRAAHLLEHERDLDDAESLAAHVLGDGEALETELGAHPSPYRRVVPSPGLHEPPDLRRRRRVLEEPPHRGTDLVLLRGWREVHGSSPRRRGLRLGGHHLEAYYRVIEHMGNGEIRYGISFLHREWAATHP